MLKSFENEYIWDYIIGILFAGIFCISLLALLSFIFCDCSPGEKAFLRNDNKIVIMYNEFYDTCLHETPTRLGEPWLIESYCQCLAQKAAIFFYELQNKDGDKFSVLDEFSDECITFAARIGPSRVHGPGSWKTRPL